MNINQLWHSYPKIRRLLQWGAIGFPFGLMGRNLYHNWQILQQYNWTPDPCSAILSAIFFFAAFLLMPLSTRLVLLMLNYELPYTVTYRAYFLSQLAKYLPGGIWIVPGRMVILSQVGVSAAASGMGVLIEVYVMVVTGSLIFIPYMIFETSMSAWLIVLIGIIGILLLTILYPPLLSRLLKCLPWFRSIHLHSNFLLAFYLVSIVIGFWLLIGSAFFWLVRSVVDVSFNLWPILMASYSMAWVVGFLVFLTPGGLGVREGALTLLLSAILPSPIATLIALLARIGWSLTEIVCVGIASMGRTQIKIDKPAK